MTADDAALLDRAAATPSLAAVVEDLAWHPDAAGRVLTGRWRADGRSCVVKPVAGVEELAWMPAVSARSTDVVAPVLASGELAPDGESGPASWLALERLTLRGRSDESETVTAVMRTVARFQQVALDLDLPTYPIDAALVEDFASRSAADPDCPGAAAEVGRRAAADDAWLRSLGEHVRGHGDVHFWNVMAPAESGPWRLIDPIPRTAHWAWDAAYAQLTSGVSQTPDLIGVLAQERRRLGLPTTGPSDLPRVRTVLLGWSAVLWWPLQQGRRDDPWWVAEIGRRMDALASLDPSPPRRRSVSADRDRMRG